MLALFVLQYGLFATRLKVSLSKLKYIIDVSRKVVVPRLRPDKGKLYSGYYISIFFPINWETFAWPNILRWLFFSSDNLSIWEMLDLKGLQFHLYLHLHLKGPILTLQSFEYLQMCFSLPLYVIPLKSTQFFAKLEPRFILTPFLSLYCINRVCCDVRAIMTSRASFIEA